MKLYHISATFLLFAAFLFNGCSGSTEQAGTESSTPAHLVRITRAQFSEEQMELGDAVMHTFTQIYRTNGIVTASPQSKADVYSYISGIIRSISVNLGSRVRKGQVLITIESKEFITLQQQYLEALAKLEATELDYQRIKTLYEENISSKKDFIAIESKYKILQATIEALKAELKILNVDLKKLEAGNLSMYLQIVAPITGTITLQKCNLGEFVDSQELLMKIIDNRDLQLLFYVYQENVNKLQKGQVLDIYTPDDPETIYNATIISVGKAIDPVTKSIDCLAKPEERVRKIFVDGMYFQVEVKLDTIRALAVPDAAIIKTGNNRYVLIKEKEDEQGLYFKKEEVKTGIVSGGFTEIKGNMPLKDVLVKGAYYFQSQ